MFVVFGLWKSDTQLIATDKEQSSLGKPVKIAEYRVFDKFLGKLERSDVYTDVVYAHYNLIGDNE